MTSVAQNNFWSADDKLPISQKSVSIPSANGLNYSAGQRIQFQVPSTVEYIQPKECYLSFEVQIKYPNLNPDPTLGVKPTRLQLDPVLGGQSLIKEISIMSGGAGSVLLEQYENYNVLTYIKYSYSTNDVLRAKRALTEGSTFWSSHNRGTCGTTQSHQASIDTNPWFRSAPDQTTALAPAWNDDKLQKVKCLLPINTGLFQNSKILPVLMLEGLKLDIILEDAVKCVRQLDSARLATRQGLKPVFHSINGGLGAGAAKGVTAKTPFKNIFLANDNTLLERVQCPFVPGERVNFVELATGTRIDTDANPFIIDSVVNGGTGLIELISAANCEAQTDVPIGGLYGVYSESIQEQTEAGVQHYDCNYVVSNAQLILQQLEMPAGYTSKMRSMMKEGGVMNYDFLSSTNYKHSQLSSDTVTNMRLPLNQSRCKAILSVPTDATTYNSAIALSGGLKESVGSHKTFVYDQAFPSADGMWCSDTSGLTGITDSLNNYQYFYDGKLNPSRKVDCVKTSGVSISQQPLIELEKALAQCDLIPYSFRMFKESFCIGRALSLHNGVYDARGRDFNIQLEYDVPADGQAKNKLWHNFVHHVRRIEFRGDGISVLV